uniref:Uncharacterized protein n=1 Tax=Oryza glumipatula TaxID=40148 RepID=A0A0D9Y8W1_9ORYZ
MTRRRRHPPQRDAPVDHPRRSLVNPQLLQLFPLYSCSSLGLLLPDLAVEERARRRQPFIHRHPQFCLFSGKEAIKLTGDAHKLPIPCTGSIQLS